MRLAVVQDFGRFGAFRRARPEMTETARAGRRTPVYTHDEERVAR